MWNATCVDTGTLHRVLFVREAGAVANDAEHKKRVEVHPSGVHSLLHPGGLLKP